MSDTATPRRHLGRLGLVIWLVLPLLIVAAMWFIIDRSQGKPDPRLMHHEKAAPTATDAKPISIPPPSSAPDTSRR